MSSPPASSGRFPTTRWTLILGAREGDSQRRAALDVLCATYWRPVYFYVRRKGLDADAAQDAVQGLFAHLLERDFLERLDPARGRFRSYLRTCADHYLSHQRRAARAEKRGGRVKIVDLDAETVEPRLAALPEDPLAAFEREWALTVMSRALEKLRGEYTSGRRRGNVDVIFRFFQPGPPLTYAEAAALSGVTVELFKVSLHRARARFRQVLLDEVADTVDGVDAQAELADLMRILGS